MADVISQVLRFCQPQVALVGLCGEPSLSQGLQDGSEVVEMIGPGGQMYDVIQVCRCELTMGLQDNVHEPLEAGWHHMDAKREDPVLPVA